MSGGFGREAQTPTLLELLLQQDGLQGRVQLLRHVLQQDPLAEPDTVLEVLQELLVALQREAW